MRRVDVVTQVRILVCSTALAALAACGNPDGGAVHETTRSAGADEGRDEQGEPVVPPFAVQKDLEGLLLIWFDADGAHTAENRGEIPEARRSRVRVDSLTLAPEQRLDADHVYVADVRNADAQGAYQVRKVKRTRFEAWIDRATGAPPATASSGATPWGEVVIYGASWCGACRAAAKHFRKRGVAFVEKDIEKDRGAHAEMQQKAKQAGVRPHGVPVIDVRGKLLLGFDAAAIDRLLAKVPDSPAKSAPAKTEPAVGGGTSI